jgi:hypothetical protein
MVGGQQSTRSLPHLAELFRLADAAGLLEQPDRCTHEDAAGGMRSCWRNVHGECRASASDDDGRCAMRDFSAGHEWLSINTATVRKQRGQDWPLPDHRRLRAARHPRHRALARPGGRGGPGGGGAAAARHRHHLSGYCRGGFFPAADAAGLQAALDDNRRAVDEACTLQRPCLVLVVGSLPGALAGKPRTRTSPARAPRCRRHRRHCWRRAQRGHAAGHRAAAPDAGRRARLHQHAGAGAGRVRRAGPRAQRRAGRGGGRVPRLVGPEAAAQIARAGASALLAFHVCDWLTPTRDLLNDRGMMGDGVIELPKIRGWVEAARLPGFAEVEIFSAQRTGGSATAAKCWTPASRATAARSDPVPWSPLLPPCTPAPSA